MRLRKVGERVLKRRHRTGDPRQLHDGPVELHQDGTVLGLLHHRAEEDLAGGDLVADVGALASAGVDHQGQREWKFGALREVSDLLRLAVLLKDEIPARQTADRRAGLVAYDGRDCDQAGVYLQRCDR